MKNKEQETMPKRKKISKWIILIAIVAVVLLIIGVCRTMFEHYENIRGQHLNSYSYSSGGGMLGAYRSQSVKRYEDRALITIESAEWHSQDPTVTEYLTDAAVLDELEAVVRKHRMNFWHRKEFTHMFVFDGESESYHFAFDDAYISFSSQIYPLKYAKKLAELDQVVKKYIEVGERLPGLVNPRTQDEENYFLPEGELEIYVYSYAGGALGLKILNGTDEDIEIPKAYKLTNADTGEVLAEEKTPYGGWFTEHTADEMSIKLQERLDAGNYMILYGDMEIPFEIR